MKRLVTLIVLVTIIFNVVAAPALAVATPTPPPKKVACLPVCAPVLLPALSALMTLILRFGMMFTTIVAAHEVSTALDSKVGERKTKTIIYRRDNPTCANMTPRNEVDTRTGLPKDWMGLSYQLTKPLNGSYTVTVLEALNETGQFKAIRDGIDHVSVRGINDADHAAWMATRPNCLTGTKEMSVKSKLLTSVSVYVK